MSRTFTNYEDQPTRDFLEDYGSDLCGPKSYEIYLYDKETLLIGQIDGAGSNQPTAYYSENNYSDWFAYSIESPTHTLSVFTDDPSKVNNEWQTFYIKVMLDDYYLLYPETIHYDSFRVMLKNCQVADFSEGSMSQLGFGANSQITYNVYTPVYWIYLPEVTQVLESSSPYRSSAQQCGYTLTYTPTWKTFYDTQIDLPPFVTWNESERRFEIYSEDPNDIDTTRQTYLI